MLALRNLRYYWRGNLALLFGVAVGAAVLAGALFVGDSLRQSLKEKALRQANGATAAYTGERLLDDHLAAKLGAVPALVLRGTLKNAADGTVARVVVYGLDDAGVKALNLPEVENWSGDEKLAAILSHPLAKNLNAQVGLRLQLSVQQMSVLPKSSPLGRRKLNDQTQLLNPTVRAVLPESSAANEFTLMPGPEQPLNLFVPLRFLQDRLGLGSNSKNAQEQGTEANRVNAFFAFGPSARELNERLDRELQPPDWGLKILVPKGRDYIAVESTRLVLPNTQVNEIVKAAEAMGLRAEPTTVYLANWIAADESRRVPYSIVAALDANAAAPLGPFLPNGVKELKDDEIVLTEWPESPLKDLPLGATITLIYFKPEIEGREEETTATFKLAGRIPISGAADDRDLTPPFPGITDKLKIGDWNPPFTFEAGRVKRVDEDYWNNYRTTPKAYISRAAGEKLFASRFGVTTSVRIAPSEKFNDFQRKIAETLNAKSLGIQFSDTSAQLAKASVGGTDFGGLFLGFSFFLILAALILVGLFTRLGVERRARDIGSLLALGYAPKAIRNSLLAEALIVSLPGAALGVAVAFAYSRGLIDVLASLWPDGSVKAILKPHESTTSILIGAISAVAMSMIAVFFAVRGLVKLPIPLLLKGKTDVPLLAATSEAKRKRGFILAVLALLLGITAIAAGPFIANPDMQAMAFFSGGGLLLAAGLLLIRIRLRREGQGIDGRSSLLAVAIRNAGRYPSRSLLTILLLASAAFLLLSVESFRRRPSQDFASESGGSGGFNLLATLDVTVFEPFSSEAGKKEFLARYAKELQNAPELPRIKTVEEAATVLGKIQSSFAMRKKRGDDASCLNLYQAGQPRLLGVPKAMIERKGFQFSASLAMTEQEKDNPWLLLAKPQDDGAIPVIGEQNSVMWMLKKSLGDIIEIADEDGAMRKCRIVATLQDSVFQSELLTSDTAFLGLYPREEGFSEFLIRCDPADEADVRAVLEFGLQSHGMMVSRSVDRVAAYQAVIGTYLTTFQILGGLGLLLGILGLAAIVLRNVWDRLGEFALLGAVGFSKSKIRTLVLLENLFLIVVGLGLGVIAAGISVAPHAAMGGRIPWQGLLLLFAGVLAAGTIVIWLATRAALRVPILAALRAE